MMEIAGRNHGNGNLLFGIYDNLVELSVNYGRMAFTNESDNGGQRRLPSMNLYTHPLTTFPHFPISPFPNFPISIPLPLILSLLFRFLCLFSFSMTVCKYISISVLATRTWTQTEVVEQGLNDTGNCQQRQQGQQFLFIIHFLWQEQARCQIQLVENNNYAVDIHIQSGTRIRGEKTTNCPQKPQEQWSGYFLYERHGDFL